MVLDDERGTAPERIEVTRFGRFEPDQPVILENGEQYALAWVGPDKAVLVVRSANGRRQRRYGGRMAGTLNVATSWRGHVNSVLYGLIFRDRLDEGFAARTARGMVDIQVFPAGPAVYYEAFGLALSSEETLTDTVETPHEEPAFREFLAQVMTELDALRPWSEVPVG